MHDRTNWRLPTELQFIIIDCVLGDKATLASCSLVCSQWLQPSRKHLFKDVTLKTANHLSPDPVVDFLRIVEHSGEVNPEWAIGPYVNNFKLDGRLMSQRLDDGDPTTTCTLDILRALLSRLPHLASLCVKKCLILDDTSQDNKEQGQGPRFELDELTISECSGPGEDPRHLLALICTFSSVGSLTVHHWGQWTWEMFSPFPLIPFLPIIVRSLTMGLVKDQVAARSLYALLANSPSVTNAHLTRLSIHATDSEDLRMFAHFANIAGAALRDVELRVQPDIPLDQLHDNPLTACTALSSFTLSIDCNFEHLVSTDEERGEDTRVTLRDYTEILHMHREVFTELTTVRFEMIPAGEEMLNAFVRVAQDTCRQWFEPSPVIRTVESHEARWNSEVLVWLEDALCGFSALEHVEFVLYETSERGCSLAEAEKVELRGHWRGGFHGCGQAGSHTLCLKRP